jgi:hypothetical protein
MKQKFTVLMAMLFFAGIAFGQNQAIDVSKDFLDESLNKEQTSLQTITISNQGDIVLDFNIEAFETSQGINFQPNSPAYEGDDSEDLNRFFTAMADAGMEGVSWLNLSAVSKTLQPGGSIEIDVTFNAAGMQPGMYSAYFRVNSNDPEKSYILIPVQLQVMESTRQNCIVFQGTDNERPALDGIPDGDMDVYICYNESLEPIEFNMFVTEPTVTSCVLSIYAFDIDETSGETDRVYINGNYLGDLTGANNVWSTTVFNVPAAWVNDANTNGGKNLIEIDIFVSGWCVEVDFAQMNLNDCNQTPAYFRYVNLDELCYAPNDNIGVEIEVDTDQTPDQLVFVEYNLLDQNQVNVAGNNTPNFLIVGTQDEPVNVSFTLPGSAQLGDTWYIQAIVYDANTFVQQDSELVPFLVAEECAPPVPISDGAVGIGIALILLAALLRIRRFS